MKIVIIGNGIAGTTAALAVRDKDKKAEITMISAESDYLYSRPALMYIYLKHMKFENTMPYEVRIWKKKKIQLIKDWVVSVDYSGKKIQLKNGQALVYDKLILATGSKGNKFGWPGQDLPGVTTFVNLQDLEEIEKITANFNSGERAVVVGGGLIGMEFSEMMVSRDIPVTLLVREKWYWDIAFSKEEGDIIREEMEHHGVDLRLETELKQIIAGQDGSVASIETNKEEKINCGIVAITAGVSPAIDFLKESELDIGRGVKVNRRLETNIVDVYACGDCAEIKPDPDQKGQRPIIEALWYTGKMQAKVLVENLFGGSQEYSRGTWYNSAKFYSIDYHTYGLVGHKIAGEQEVFYRVPDQRKSIRISYLPDRVLGFNLLGIRYRDKVCRRWLDEKRSLSYVLEHLHEANFDGEFYKRFEEDMKNHFREKIA